MVQATPQSYRMDYFDAPHIGVMQSDNEHANHLKGYLERQGFRVTTAATRDKVIDWIAQDPPDLLILDLAMPGIDSLDLCQQVKHDAALGFLPVIIVTDTHEEHQRLAGMLSGADDYLARPLVFKELFMRVQTLLRIKRQYDDLVAQNSTLATDLQERSAELEEAHQVAEQVKMLQRHFIHNVNHELRTPLLQIKSSISMLNDILQEEVTNPQANKLAAMATQATARLENVVQNITQFEVFEHIRREPIILDHVIRSAVKHFHRSWAHHKSLDRIKTFTAVKVPPVIGDQRAATRLLINLIENALKFSEPDSPIEISVRLLKDQNLAWVGVKDYGIGIPEDKFEEVFHPFTQLDTGSTREFDGLGVGLPIAHMLARGMGTRIEIRSKVGEGSVFSFTLPLIKLKD